MSRVSARAWKVLLGTCLALLPVGPALGVVNGTSVPCSDRRFDAVGAFLTDYGGGSCGGALSGTCTLIAPDKILIARHCLDIGTSSPTPDVNSRTWRARFRRAANGSAANSLYVNGTSCHGIYTERRVVAFIDAPPPNNADQVVCVLDSPVTGIRPIGVELNDPPRASQQVILAGWGYDGACFQSGEWGVLKVSRGNMPANFAVNDYLVFSPCALGAVSPCQTICPGSGGPYVMGNLYDSGAPVLIEVPSTDPRSPQPELRLVGTVSSPTGGRRPSAFNNAWGLQTPAWSIPQAPLGRNIVADFNIDTRVNIDDVLDFVGAYLAGVCTADLVQTGRPTVDSVFMFLNAYFQAGSGAGSPGTMPILNGPGGGPWTSGATPADSGPADDAPGDAGPSLDQP